MERDRMLELIAFILVTLLLARGYTGNRLNKVSKQLEDITSKNDERLDKLANHTLTLKEDVGLLSNRVETIEDTIQSRTPAPTGDKDDLKR
jgi:outer membrane murein-binding lipoprotein Lpp